MMNFQNMQNMQNAMMNSLQNMQQQINPQNNPVNPAQSPTQSPSNSKFINLYFRISENQNESNAAKNDKANLISIQCTLDDKLSDIVEKYRTKSLDRAEKNFVFNAKKLNLSLTAAEAGLNDNSTIFVLDPRKVKGA